MITLIVPTRNRGYTLRLTARSYYEQALVTEIIFVDDAGTDDTAEVVAVIASDFPETETRILRNEERKGAAYNRIAGYRAARNDYVLYCDDDEYLERDYARTCLEKMHATGATIVSGRRIIKTKEERPEDTVRRFGDGLTDEPPFNYRFCEFNRDATFSGDLALPLTNSIILTRRETLERFGYDPFYAKANGYREESDFQMAIYCAGLDILVTNDVHSIHLSREECRTGGQRFNRFSRLYWNVFYTDYFYGKYWDRYAERAGLSQSKNAAVAAFALYQVYFLFIKPFRRLLPGREGSRSAARPRRNESAPPAI